MYKNLDWELYFNPEQLTDRTVKSVEYQEYKPLAGPSEDAYNSGTVQFEIARGSADKFMIAQQGYLSVTYELQKSNGTAFAATDNVALLNGASLFSRIDCTFNGGAGVTGSPNDEPAEYQLLKTLLELQRSSDAERSAAYQFLDTINGGPADLDALNDDVEENTSESFQGLAAINNIGANAIENEGGDALDKEKVLAVLNSLISNINTIDDVNRGQAQRLRACKANEQNTIRIPLPYIHPFFDHRKAIRGISVRLTLHRQTEIEKAILAGSATLIAGGFRFRIKQMSVVVPFVTPHPDTFNKIHKGLTKKDSFMYPYRSVQMHKSYHAAGVIDQAINTTGKYVTGVYVGFRGPHRWRNVGKAGNIFLRNKLIFDLPKSISGFYCIMDGQHYPVMGYDSLRPTGWVPAYEEFMKAAGGGIKDADYPVSIDFKQWKDVYPIFAFDMSHTDTAMITSSAGQLRIRANLDLTGTALALTGDQKYEMMVWIVSDEYIELHEEDALLKSRQVGEPILALTK